MTGLVEGEDPYVYPGTTVLKNTRNLQAQDTLERFERTAVAARTLTITNDFPISSDGYQAIHQYLFQDVYDWAGQYRRVDLWSGDVFAFAQHIDREVIRRFEMINAEGKLVGLDRYDFAERVAEHLCEINAIHPFREGNGRTHRSFLKVLAHHAGHELAIDKIDRDRWMKGSIEGFRHQDYALMSQCIYEAMTGRTHQQDQRDVGHDEGHER